MDWNAYVRDIDQRQRRWARRAPLRAIRRAWYASRVGRLRLSVGLVHAGYLRLARIVRAGLIR